MYPTGDTIVAIATPPGRGAIGVVRLSGPSACEIASRLFNGRRFQARRASLVGWTSDATGVADRLLVTTFSAPHSYTGEDVVELSAHGAPVILQALRAACEAAGARAAGPGEFTYRAVLHGRMDLVQAEAVGDLIAAETPLQARLASEQLDGRVSTSLREIDAALREAIAALEAQLDFPEDEAPDAEAVLRRIAELRGEVNALLDDSERGLRVREGARIAIVGRANVGKSSLFNALLGSERAIVASEPGTTRDVLAAVASIGGLACELVDTAGARVADDVVEREGQRRAEAALRSADVAVAVFDGQAAFEQDDASVCERVDSMPCVFVINKSDLGTCETTRTRVHTAAGGRTVVVTSAASGAGLAALRQAVAAGLGDEATRPVSAAITNRRHIGLLRECSALLAAAARTDGQAGMAFLVSDLYAAQRALAEVTGRFTSDDVLEAIFGRFCIGK